MEAVAMSGLSLPNFELVWDDFSADLFEIESSRSNSRSYIEPNRVEVDDRKIRRMISNRESARRSRMRKQKHLENMRNEANRLRLANRDLANQLGGLQYGCEVLGQENNRLRVESVALRQRLWQMGRVLALLRKIA